LCTDGSNATDLLSRELPQALYGVLGRSLVLPREEFLDG
jgi:hypothetical protein